MLRFACILVIFACPASAEKRRAKAAKLLKEYRTIPADHAFYMGAKLAGQAVLDGEIQKAKQIWHIYIKAHSRQKYVAPAAVQAALIARIGAGGEVESNRVFQRVSTTPGPREGLMGKHCTKVARRWLAATQTANLRSSLEKYYSSNLEFPRALNQLAKADLVSKQGLLSPWGTPFSYRVVANKVFSEKDAQAYELSAKEMIGSPLKPGEALKQWAELLPRYVLWGVGESGDGRPMALIGKVERGSKSGGKTSVILGETHENLRLIQADKIGAILASNDAILVLPQRTLNSHHDAP
ncbi:MAG: hypothetical protein QF473_28965 [Planctomycetota bacterium]|nr:hypothetical protein [Planctomycetota bacterium]